MSDRDDDGDYGEAYDEDYDVDLAEDADEFELAEDADEKEEKEGIEDEDEKEDDDEIADEAQAELEAEAEAEEAEGETAEEDEESALSKPAAVSKVRVDPILRASNTHRRVVVVPDNERITSNVLKITECARAIAIRAQQIETSPIMFTDPAGETDSVALAKAELLARRSPLKLRRIVGRGTDGAVYVEDWRVNEMTLPPVLQT
jgi:hypothetical protein